MIIDMERTINNNEAFQPLKKNFGSGMNEDNLKMPKGLMMPKETNKPLSLESTRVCSPLLLTVVVIVVVSR